LEKRFKAENIELTDRQNNVLKTVIGNHIKSATPVGSRHISEKLGYSSATIRNVMSELEEMGFIDKPHTSAGRVPTCMGYRYYVNNLMELDSISRRQKDIIEREYYERRIETVEEMLRCISHLLSMLTRYAGIACVSSLKFYMEGASYMLDMPEFRDVDKMRILLELFDRKTELLKLLNEEDDSGGVRIHIGEDEKSGRLKDLSLISASYNIKQKHKGSLGILGPLRMDYASLIPLVDFVSRAIEEIINETEINCDW